MKKKMYVLGVAALVAALLALSGVAQSAMWVGGELGGNWNYANASWGPYDTHADVRTSVIGGVTLGYDFINAGFAGANYPSWMQYFSIATDLTYNRLQVYQGSGLGNILSPNARLNGYEIAWTFLLMAHYGFLKDSEIPSGRINPYIGVGPAIVFTGIQGTFPTRSPDPANPSLVPRSRYNNQNVYTSNFGDNAINVGLVVEPGIRWVCFKNVSVDTAMRYRYSVPSWDADATTVKLNPLHQFAFLLRANYHF